MEKPTLGIVPEQIWKDRRLEDLRKAIRRANHPVPAEWIDELNRLLVDIYGPVNKVSFSNPTNKIPPKKKLIESESELKSKSIGADCFDGVKNINPRYIEQLRVIPVYTKAEENLSLSGPIVLQLEIDTRSVEDFLKGVSFGIKLKK
ncbi:hypothetical protein CMU86_11695 [Elizabethkingia anophelis]|nr:hypothetical protein [Elizabethkingia anophelis]